MKRKPTFANHAGVPTNRGVSPNSAEVEARVLKVARRHPRLVTAKVAGRSQEGRRIWAVTVNDPRAADDDKQHFLAVGGRHGNEESGRMLALALLDWLVTEPARETLRKQTVVILPNVNPDGCERDVYRTVTDVNVGGDARTDRSIPETEALFGVTAEFVPGAVVDLHSRGGSGCSYDMVLYSETRRYTEDDNLYHEIAFDMCAAGARAGIPQSTHPLDWWDPGKPFGLCHHCYANFKSIAILTETAESNPHSYPAKDRVRSGLAKLKTMLEWGNRRYPRAMYAGYTNQVVVGMFNLGIVALGKTAASRRASRAALWKQADRFDRLALDLPEKWREKTAHLHYSGERVREGAGVQIEARGRLEPVSVKLNGRRLRRSETRGYSTWAAGPATYVVVAIPDLKPGKYRIDVRFR